MRPISGTSTSARWPRRSASLDRVQIDLGLAAAGDAIEQEGREASMRRIDGVYGRGLFVDQRRALATDEIGGEIGRRGIGIFGRRREAARHQRAHRCAPITECFRERVAGHAFRRAQRFEQFTLPWRALELTGFERGQTRLGREPPFGQRARWRTLARQLGQRCGDHLAQRVVVVLRGPFEQFHHLGVDDRRRVDDVEHRLEFFGRYFRARGEGLNDADEMLAAEGDSHTHAWLRAMDGIVLREVIEKPP